MKLDDYKMAQRIRERIEEFDKMEETLHSAIKDVKEKRKLSDTTVLALLITELIETKEGERVLDYIEGTITMKFENAKRELEIQFDEL